MRERKRLSGASKGSLVVTLLFFLVGLLTFLQDAPPAPSSRMALNVERFVLLDGPGLEGVGQGEGVALRLIADRQGTAALAPWPLGKKSATESQPLLPALQAFAPAQSLLIFLDLSPALGAGERTKLLEQILAALSQSGRATDQVVIVSANWLLLDELASLTAGYRLGYASSEQPEFDTVQRQGSSTWLGPVDWAAVEGSLPQLVRQRSGDLWLPHFRDLRQVDLDEAHALGLEVYVWPATSKDQEQGLKAMGVDGFLSEPSAL